MKKFFLAYSLFCLSLFLIFIGIYKFIDITPAKAVLPNSIVASSPTDNDLVSAGAGQIRNLKTFLEDTLGFPDNTSITAPIFGISSNGNISIKQNAEFVNSSTFDQTTSFASTSILTGTWSGTIVDNATHSGNPQFTGIPSYPNQSACSLYMNASNVTATNGSRISYDTKAYDNQSECDITTNKGRFTAKNSGLYLITVGMNVQGTFSSGSTYEYPLVLKNAVTILCVGSAFNYFATMPFAYVDTVVSCQVKLSASDFIEILPEFNAITTPVFQNGQAQNYFQISKIQ